MAANIKPMRVIFMGSPDFALPTLKALQVAGHEVVAVYSQPPKPAHRGQKLTPCPVHAYAEAQGLAVYTPESLKSEEAHKTFAHLQADVAVVVAYGLLLPKAILQAPRYGCLNLHPSLLPRWRGAAPIQYPIWHGDAQTAVCIMQMDEGWDTGDILLYKKIPLPADITTPVLQQQLAELGAELMVQALVGLQHQLLKPIKQSAEGVTYAKKLSKEDSKINWKRPAIEIERQVRALNPWPSCFFLYKSEQIKLLQAEAVDLSPKATSGEVLLDPGISGDSLLIRCGEGCLKITQAQRPNRSAMDGQTLAKSLNMQDGDRLG